MGVVYRALVGSTTSIVEWRRVGGEWSPPQETILCEDVFVENVRKPFGVNKWVMLPDNAISTVIPTS
jgi:hypothetical protein